MTGFFDCLAVPVGIMYISEVSEVKLKGSLLSSTTAASGIGIALAYCTGIVFYWRYACAFPIISSGLSIFLLYFCKESPVYLLTQNKPAVAALSWYRETKEASNNTDLETREELKNLEFETSSSGKGFQLSLTKLLDGPNIKPFLILVGLFILYPLTGMYSITFFAIDLFKKLNLGSAETVAIISAVMRILGTSLSSLLIFKHGRRKIMLVSSASVTLTIGLVAMFVVLKEGDFGINETLISWILVMLIFIFMFIIGVSVCNLPWVLMGKIHENLTFNMKISHLT